MVLKNPAKLVDPQKETKSEMDVWDIDEVRSFLEIAKRCPFYMVYLYSYKYWNETR
jgi:hypothetical protein